MTSNFYSAPSNQIGGYIVYGGYRRQRGAGAFGSFRKFLAPVASQAFQGVKSFVKSKQARNLGRNIVSKGVSTLGSVAADALQGRNVGEAIKERSKEAALQALTGNNTSSSSGKKRKRKNLKQKKRSHSSQAASHQAPPAKKRRKASSRAAQKRRKELF